MEPIYVTGHRNPDTDSIVAAMAYAALRNALGDREYVPACLGHISDETKIVLNRFGCEAPKRIHNMFTQVKDLEFDTPPLLSQAVHLGRAWEQLMGNSAIPALPVANEDGSLYGMLSREDVASYNMEMANTGFLEPVPLFNLLSVLEGQLVGAAGQTTDYVSGQVTIALPQNRENLLFQNPQSIVLCGDQPDMIERAIRMKVNCLVLCQAEPREDLRNIDTPTCIITTPFDAYRAARMIFQSTPIRRICRTGNIVSFHLEDRVDEVEP